MKLPDLATDKYRWLALVFLALSSAIVIIDNNVLTVAIPYILRDLHTTFNGIQWVLSGYSLIIATLLITVGRTGDLFGRKRLFLCGTILFATGSFIASISTNVLMLFIGEALIEAIGAAMMLTSSLALLVTEFHGRERAIAFGIWGSVAGASASIGPLLGGFLTTYYSWRWSLRINVIIAVIAILGSVFIKEAYGKKTEKFDWLGVVFSSLGLFSLVFGCIEGRNFGWWSAVKAFAIGNLHWYQGGISIIPFIFLMAVIFLALFIFIEYRLEKDGKEPLLRISLFKNAGFSLGLIAIGILVMGQFGTFFIFPLYYQNVLGLTAFQTGLLFLWTSVTIAITGALSGYLASKFGPKWIVVIGMLASFLGIFWLSSLLSIHIDLFSLVPGLILLGSGIGLASSQVTNIILSHVPQQFSGEASAVNVTFRQIGASIGTALIGTVLAANLAINITTIIHADKHFSPSARQYIMTQLKNYTAESGTQALKKRISNPQTYRLVKTDIDYSLVSAAKTAFHAGLFFIAIGIVLSVFIPEKRQVT